jgi:fatty acid desaturase
MSTRKRNVPSRPRGASNPASRFPGEFTKLDNWHWIRGFAEAAGPAVVACTIASMLPSPTLVRVVASAPFTGASLKAFATLLHESAHGTLAANATLNRRLGVVAGAIVLQGRQKYVRSHLAGHHGKQGDLHGDPDLSEQLRIGLYDTRSSREFWWRFLAAPLLGSRLPSYWRYLRRDRVEPAAWRTVPLLITLAVIASVWLPHGGAVLRLALASWLVAVAVVFPIIGWYVELSEHFPMAAFAKSRSATRHRACGPLSRNFVGMVNERYHLLHHTEPRIPFWRLRDGHEYLMSSDEEYFIAVTAQGGAKWRFGGFVRQLLGLYAELEALRASRSQGLF